MFYVSKLCNLLENIEKALFVFSYRILLLSDTEESEKEDEHDTFYQMLSLSIKDIFVPDAKPKDMLLTVQTQAIKAVTKYHTKMEFDLVLKDCDQRQLPRFRYVKNM